MSFGNEGDATAVFYLDRDESFLSQDPNVQQYQQAVEQPKPPFMHTLYFMRMALFLHPIVWFGSGFIGESALQVNPGQLQGNGTEGIIV